MTITRRTIQIGLGLVWLLDGALQFQSFMFTRAFGGTVIAPTGQGQPGFISHPVHWVSMIVIHQPVLTNTAFALVQVAIGLGLLWRRTSRVALAGSVLWGVSVWYLGEGLGGLTTGENLLTGAPGAALLYALIALVAWPDRDGDSSVAPSPWAIPTWVALWVMGVGMQLAAGNNTGGSFASMFRDAASDNGGWIGSIDSRIGAQHIGNGWVAGVIAVELLVAMWALIPGRTRQLSVATGALFAGAVWLVVQGLGDLTSGQSTDPNSGPLILLLALAVAGAQTAPWRETAVISRRSHSGVPAVATHAG